uniref:Uncharacterized protein n=1 Tax=Lepeophtheirus salmonis TaxID=72036 RepID=A0A0K2U9F8_LEPSM
MASFLENNLPSFAVVVGEEGDVVNGRQMPQKKSSYTDKRLIAFDDIFQRIISGVHILKARRIEDWDHALCWRRAKEFETRTKRHNFELKQKVHMVKSKGCSNNSMHCNQALRVGRNILTSYIHYLPLSSNQLSPDGILTSFNLLIDLFDKFEGGESLIHKIEEIKELIGKDSIDTKSKDAKKLIADLALLKFGKKPNPIKNVKSNVLLQERIQRSRSIRYGNLKNNLRSSKEDNYKQTAQISSLPQEEPSFSRSQSNNDQFSVKILLSRIAELESGIENVMVNSSSVSYIKNKNGPLSEMKDEDISKGTSSVDITDTSLKEIQSLWKPGTHMCDFLQIELCINQILDEILLELSEEMTSPTLIFDILKRELL